MNPQQLNKIAEEVRRAGYGALYFSETVEVFRGIDSIFLYGARYGADDRLYLLTEPESYDIAEAWQPLELTDSCFFLIADELEKYLNIKQKAT